MPQCPKCGAQVGEEMAFCPMCGAPLKIEKPLEAAASTQAPAPSKAEKTEKHEKEEKGEKKEKTEKHEKRELGFAAPLIAGLILIFLGAFMYLQAAGILNREIAGALFFIILGIIIIVAGVYAVVTASKRHPKV